LEGQSGANAMMVGGLSNCTNASADQVAFKREKGAIRRDLGLNCQKHEPEGIFGRGRSRKHSNALWGGVGLLWGGGGGGFGGGGGGGGGWGGLVFFGGGECGGFWVFGVGDVGCCLGDLRFSLYLLGPRKKKENLEGSAKHEGVAIKSNCFLRASGAPHPQEGKGGGGDFYTHAVRAYKGTGGRQKVHGEGREMGGGGGVRAGWRGC